MTDAKEPTPDAGEVVASTWTTIKRAQKEINTFERPSAQSSSDLIVVALRLLNALDAANARADAAERERDEANAGWRNASELLDAAVGDYNTEHARAQALEADLLAAREALRPFADRFDAWSKVGPGSYEDEEYSPKLFRAMQIAARALSGNRSGK